MALIKAVNYDPATKVTVTTGGRTVMTAFDTTNLRITFNAPASGNVLVRIACPEGGNSYLPVVLFGVMAGATVVRRVMTNTMGYSGVSSMYYMLEAVFTVTGLTAGASYTWDAAYGVEVGQFSTYLAYGGPNTLSELDGLGAFVFEIWEA